MFYEIQIYAICKNRIDWYINLHIVKQILDFKFTFGYNKSIN